MTKWQITRYLIDAKKEVDSLWFIAAYANKINLNLKTLTEIHRNKFYIDAASIVDKLVETKGRKYKKDLCNTHPLINTLFYYRDKHAAHKDADYHDKEYSSIMEIVHECMDILREVHNVCISLLPQELTLNFVCYNEELFRNIYGITKEDEEHILDIKHPYRHIKYDVQNPITKQIFHDTEDLWKIHDPNDYVTILQDGLTLYERLHNLQDWAIKTNVLYNQNIWVEPDAQCMRACLMMTKLGYLDIFGRLRFPQKSTQEYEHDLALMKNAERFLVYDMSIDDDAIKEAINYGR